MSYANGTDVTVQKTRAEIDRMLTAAGATGLAVGFAIARGIVIFEMNGQKVRFEVAMPTEDSPEITRSAAGRKRGLPARRRMVDAEVRRRWRALGLVLRAKLEAVESQIEIFEEAFLAHIVHPKTQKTLGATLIPQLGLAFDGATLQLASGGR